MTELVLQGRRPDSAGIGLQDAKDRSGEPSVSSCRTPWLAQETKKLEGHLAPGYPALLNRSPAHWSLRWIIKLRGGVIDAVFGVQRELFQ
ncbi:hypothetical protein STEG23_015080, partial [Scotinomys teguina]